MNENMMDKIFTEENIFYKKLEDWYKKHLDNVQLNILHIEEIDNKLVTVIFIMKEKDKVEIARVFTIGDHAEISIDLQVNTSTLGGIRKLIQYGGNFKRFEIED